MTNRAASVSGRRGKLAAARSGSGGAPAAAVGAREAAAATTDRVLLRTIMHAFYWLDDGLQAHLERQAGISVPRAQSMIMVCIGDGVQRQTDLAERLGVSKQAVQQALKELIAKGLVTVAPDPQNGRQRIVAFTARGERMRDLARQGLQELEGILAARIGVDRLEALRDALAIDWGPIPGRD
jgi:DNA-binding MarR family transcriptional regulator